MPRERERANARHTPLAQSNVAIEQVLVEVMKVLLGNTIPGGALHLITC